MERHGHFNLWLHHDDELASLIGMGISERVTVHEWPLSCVQRIQLEDGRRFIYKSQYGPTVEPEFYRRARSPLMTSGETVWESNGHSIMLIDFIDVQQVQDMKLPEVDALGMADEIMAQIAEIKGDPPYYIDISDRSRWLQFVNSTLTGLQNLVDQDRFKETTSKTVCILDRCAHDPAVLDATTRNVGLIHGDLGSDNIFVCDDGYRLIDWQRPILGPSNLNRVNFLADVGFDQLKHAPKGLLGIHDFLGVRWLTECKKTWIPNARSYDKLIVRNTQSMRDLLD